jgi:hypothetical protein
VIVSTIEPAVGDVVDIVVVTPSFGLRSGVVIAQMVVECSQLGAVLLCKGVKRRTGDPTTPSPGCPKQLSQDHPLGGGSCYTHYSGQCQHYDEAIPQTFC